MKSLKIFIIEDDVWYRNLIKKNITDLMSLPYLKKRKLIITEFSNGADSLNHLDKKPDLIICDHHLENKNFSGLKTLKEIKKYLPTTWVIMLSSQTSIDIISQSEKFKKTNYISKNQGGIETIITHIKSYAQKENLKNVKKHGIRAFFRTYFPSLSIK